ncbi:MAG TPA: heme-binding protein [Chloroflexota bacterium]
MAEVDLQVAARMTEAVIGFARDNSLRLSVAVLDGGGHVVQVSRMDGCNFLSPDIARGKAYGAVAWKVPSAELSNRFSGNPAAASGMVAISGQRIVPVQGALPIFDGGTCIGAIGVSGARSNEDEDAARAAIQAAGFSAQPG